jgi:hypothetical protein
MEEELMEIPIEPERFKKTYLITYYTRKEDDAPVIGLREFLSKQMDAENISCIGVDPLKGITGPRHRNYIYIPLKPWMKKLIWAPAAVWIFYLLEKIYDTLDGDTT